MSDDRNELIVSAVANFIGGICILEVEADTKKILPVYLNDGFYRMMGNDRAKTDYLMKNIRLSVIPDDLSHLDQGLEDIISDNGSAECEFRIVNADGSLMWLRMRGNLYERDGNRNLICVVILDCTEQKLIEEELKRQSDYMHLLMDTDITFDFNCRTDVCVYRISQTDALEHDTVIRGYLEQIPTSGIHEDDIKKYTEMMESSMKHAHRDTMEFRSKGVINPTEEYRWFKANIVSILGQEGYVAHVIGHIVDIHEEKLKEMELKLRADRDQLTGLLNKAATEKLIRKILEQYTDGRMTGAFMMLDADSFKSINDNYGHMTGDRVLSKIGEVLTKNFKGGDVAGRVGGDEFMVFMHNIREAGDACTLAQKVEDLVMHAFDGEDFGDKVSLSIGISICPKDGADFETLFSNADKALYKVKKKGKATYGVYEGE